MDTRYTCSRLQVRRNDDGLLCCGRRCLHPVAAFGAAYRGAHGLLLLGRVGGSEDLSAQWAVRSCNLLQRCSCKAIASLTHYRKEHSRFNAFAYPWHQNSESLSQALDKPCRLHSAALYGWLSKLWSLFGSPLQYGTKYLGYPKTDHTFDNHPYV